MKKYEAYKDSGVEWIGEIPESWSILKYKRLFKVSSGDFLQANEKEDDEAIGYPVYGGNGLRGYSKQFNNEGQLLLIGRVGAKCGNVHLVNGKYWVSEHALRVLKRRMYDDFYMKYLLELTNFNQYAITTAQPLINSDIVLDRVSILPSLEEQTQIANYLDRKTTQIDDLISKKEKLIELLKEERTAIINQAVTKGLDPTVPMKDSGIEWLGEIPEHWEVAKLKLFVDKITDGSHHSPPTEEMGKRYLSVKDIGNNEILFEKCKLISEDEFEVLVRNGCKPLKGDILLTKDGTIGRAAVVSEDNDFVVLSSLGIIRPIPAKFDSNYLREWMVSDLNVNQMLSLIQGSALTRITISIIKNLIVVIPPIEEQRNIIDGLRSNLKKMDGITAKVEKEIELLKEYKTALISEVVTGKVDVRGVEV